MNYNPEFKVVNNEGIHRTTSLNNFPNMIKIGIFDRLKSIILYGYDNCGTLFRNDYVGNAVLNLSPEFIKKWKSYNYDGICNNDQSLIDLYNDVKDVYRNIPKLTFDDISYEFQDKWVVDGIIHDKNETGNLCIHVDTYDVTLFCNDHEFIIAEKNKGNVDFRVRSIYGDLYEKWKKIDYSLLLLNDEILLKLYYDIELLVRAFGFNTQSLIKRSLS